MSSYEHLRRLMGEGRWGHVVVVNFYGVPTTRPQRQPLSGLRMGAYRPQRRAEVADVIGREGYAHRLPRHAQRWLEDFLREFYAVEAKRVRTGLHADRLKPEHVRQLPARVRTWWGRQQELWPTLALQAAMKRIGLKPKDLDTSLRRSLYNAQNAATRDVFARGVVYAEDEGGDE